MSGFLNKLSQSFSSPKPELDETSRAILDIENKKRTITQASNNEQNSIKSKISDEYRRIGETSYALYTDDNFEVEKITDMFETIKGLYQTLNEKQLKLNEILGRYDEELKILRPAPPMGQGICPHCNSAYIPGEMLFCAKCGNKLEAEGETTSEAESTSVTKNCANCNTVNVSEAVFCSGCGSKL